MIIALQYILTLLFGYKIIKTTGWQRLVWYLAGVTLVSTAFNFYSGTILTRGHLTFVLIFLASLYFEGKLKMRYLKQCPLFTPLLLVFISYICIGIFDERLNPIMGIYRGTYNYMITYGAFFFGWFSIYDKLDTQGFAKKLIQIGLIFTLYGLFSFITKTNPIVDALGYADRFVFENAGASFRSFLVSGFLLESGVYGLSCFIFFMFLWAFKSRNKRLQYTAMALLFINLFLTGTRSIMIPAIIGILIYVLFALNIKNKIQYASLGIAISLVVFVCFPNSIGTYISEIINAILDTVMPGGSGGADLGGSSVEARDMQITAAFTKYLPEKPFFGHGFSYYKEVILVYNGGVNDAELLGMESYLCFLGVEYGLINIVTVIIFFIWAIIYFIRSRTVDKKIGTLALAMTIAFIVYLATAFMGDCWLYAMPALGFLAGIIETQKRHKQITSTTKTA